MLFFSDVKQYVQLNYAKPQKAFIHLRFLEGNFRSNHTGKKIIMGCSEDRLERSLYDFEQNYKSFAYISHNSIKR